MRSQNTSGGSDSRCDYKWDLNVASVNPKKIKYTITAKTTYTSAVIGGRLNQGFRIECKSDGNYAFDIQ